MKRLAGWRSRLEGVVDEYRLSQLDFGKFDCAIFCARAIEAITGARVGDPAWWRYGSRRGGAKIMLEAGFTNLADLTASVLPEIHPSQAYIGDIAALESDTEFGYALGVVTGDRIFVVREGAGIGTVDLLAAKRAFKVG